MAYYNVCPGCGSNLDPGEKCTCSEDRTGQRDFLGRHIKKLSSGQLAFVLDRGAVQTNLTGGRDSE